MEKRLYKYAKYPEQLAEFFKTYPEAEEGLIGNMIDDMDYYFSYEYLENMFPIKPFDLDHNGSMYRQISDLDINDILNYIDSSDISSDYVFDYENVDEDRFDEDEIRDLAFEYICEYKDNVLQDKLNDAVEEYMHENANAPGFNDYGNTYGNTNDTLDNEEPIREDYDFEASDINELAALEDTKGDGVQINFSIDYLDRDNPFIYIDGEIVEGTSQQSHGQVLNEYLALNGEEETKEKWYRPTKTTLEQSLENKPVAFGSIYNNIAFVEVTESCNEEDVVKALKEDGYDFDKIYSYKTLNEPNCIRLAKKVVK